MDELTLRLNRKEARELYALLANHPYRDVLHLLRVLKQLETPQSSSPSPNAAAPLPTAVSVADAATVEVMQYAPPPVPDDTLAVYFDGSCNPNPGEMGIGIHCPARNYDRTEGMGYGTNNLAEWLALELGMAYALDFGKKGGAVWFFGDSQLVIRTMNNEQSVRKTELSDVYSRCVALQDALKRAGIRYDYMFVNRKYNLADKFSR